MTTERVRAQNNLDSSNLDALDIFPRLGLAKHEHQLRQELVFDSLTWRDLGESQITYGELSTFLRNNSHKIMPPRTGHLGGTWEAIMNGGGGELSFNRAVIELGLGYPLLFDLNMLPCENGDCGDNLYFPGYILEQGKVRELTSYSYSDGQFSETKHRPLYAPFVATQSDGQLMSINQIHRARLRNLPNVAYLSDKIVSNW